ncbi:fatty acid synthase-like [Nylanderia fulva]|uniref:fatty acid synthase-like n=1 Tax=Nylanderia fulva TaxID=613905 RepID=UPI0010FAD9B6|nr:fatty acid synthase-like [Nylanderia fulva]XP_029178051.1 fatty acid synthase-like [Nylanderia fulva]
MSDHFEGDISITGISGRLPESSNIEEFKENLMKGMDMVTEDERRWSKGTYEVPSRFGKLKDLGSFDASFFRVHPKQARVMDPQLRIMLEVTYETLIDAGINPSTLKGSRTGVFVGVSSSDANNFWKRNANGYGLLGCCRAMFANRISYAFDWNGPSYAIDTACSSSLAALHQAVLAIRTGECDSAIVGGMNLLLDPANALHFHQLNMLSNDGKCKTFDVTADGYARAEAVVAIYLQKAIDARRVYATVMNTMVNTDGYKPEGITYPNGNIQCQMLHEVYNKVGLDPKNVVYMEAHGTGTKTGDPEELAAIDKLLCKDRKTPLLIGSVKSNMGHSEPASGLCSIVKVLIAMETGVIPANLNFTIPNPMLPALKEGRMRVVDKITSWNGGLVGINSFGFGGSNSHVILRSNPKAKMSSVSETVEPMLPKLVIVSGRTKDATDVLLDKATEHLQDKEFLSLLHAVHSVNISGHNVRGYEILGHDNTREVAEANYDKKRPIWFVFSGMGSQWPGMGRELFHIEICQRSLRQCADILKNQDIDLINIIMNGTDEIYENVIVAFVSIVAIQIALVDMLISIGIQPDGIVGHSIGELSCSYADGAFTLEQTILAAYYRGKAIVDSNLKPGAMAAIGLNWEEAKTICPSDIVPACHNSARLVTISGPSISVNMFVEKLNKKNIFTKMIKCSGIAFHSKYVAEAEFKFRNSLDMIITKPKQRSHRWISSSVPKVAWKSPLAQFSSTDYHVNNLLSPVLFYEATAHIPENAITIEISPHCLLQAILCRSLPPTVTNVSLQKRNHSNNLIFLLSNVGKLYNAGAQPDISKLYLPVSFPVGRGTPMIGPLVKWDHSVTWEVPNFKHRSGELSNKHIVEVNLTRKMDAFLTGHKVNGKLIFPGAGFILMIWKTFAKLHDINFEQIPIILENLQFHRATFVPEKKTIKFFVNIFEITGNFEICESNAVVVSGNIRVAEAIEKEQLNRSPIPLVNKEHSLPMNTEDIYKELRLRGYEYSDIFKGIKSCNCDKTIGELYWFNEWTSYIDSMFQFTVLFSERKVVYISGIRYVAIDPVFHKQLVDELPKHSGLPVYYYKNIAVIKSGGIEVRGIKPTAPIRQQVQVRPKYESYDYVSYENPHNFILKDPIKGKTHALTVLLQTVCENVMTSRIKIVEVVGNRAAEDLLMPLVHDILYSEPFCNVDLQIAINSAKNYAKHFNRVNVKINTVTWNEASLSQNVHLIIAANIQSFTHLTNLAAVLKSGCFILLEVTAERFDFETRLKEENLVLVGKQIGSSGKSYVLLRKRNKKRESIVISITGKHFSWLDNAKQVFKKFDSENQEILFVSQDKDSLGLIGLMNCIRRETTNVRYVFIHDDNAPKFDLSTQFYVEQLDKGLIANVLKGGQWGSYRHFQLDCSGKIQVEHAYVNTLTKGDLSSLEWIQSPITYCQTNYQRSICSVYYASLNFKDIMLATGKISMNEIPGLPKEDFILGIEFSGRDVNGNRVMGVIRGKGLATTVVSDSDFLWNVPDKWTLEQAATIPVAYMTSYYALFVRGRLKRGETVLIHTGAGAVGQAAITIALHAGCTVFTTVGTLEKRLYLKKIFPQLSDKHIGNSRDTSFEQLILDNTQGRGVDVVLNSLAEEKLHASVRCLAINGRFLEIGKYDMMNGNRIDMSIFLKNIAFHGILFEMLFENYVDKRETIMLFSEGIENGVVRPLSTTIFSDQHLEQGFRFMATGKHIGKVLFRIREEETQNRVLPISRMMTAMPRTYMHPEKSYVLIGGLGGFGLELANWMIARGARFIILVARTGVRTGYQESRVHYWRESGIRIVISTADVTTSLGAERLIKESNQLAPVGGIFNLAAVMRDALFENLDVDDFESVILPKVNATRNLDEISRKFCPSLDHFVVFSSVSCGRGNSGQSAYGYANSVMERMMEQRCASGLPGLAIQWGPIGDVGLYVDMKNKNINLSNILPQSMSSCLATMDVFLQQQYPILSSVVVANKKHKTANSDSKVNFAQIFNVLGIKNFLSKNLDDSFEKLGVDSLGYVEIKQILEKDYDIVLSFREIRTLTVGKLRDLVLANDVSCDFSTS